MLAGIRVIITQRSSEGWEKGWNGRIERGEV